MEMTFDNWTDYDNWLVQNYDQFDVYDVSENQGKIQIKYCTKEDFKKIKDQKS